MPSWQLSGPRVRSSLAFHLNEASQSKFLLSTLSATRPPPLERQDLPLSGHCPSARSTASLGGYLLLAPGVSTVRYPIPQRTFKYVATVQSVTDETCQLLTSANWLSGDWLSFRPT